MTTTEFVSADSIFYGNENSKQLIMTFSDERPRAVQLFGNSVEKVLTSAKIVEHDFDVIDLNCGCPARKVMKNGSGSRLMGNPNLLFEIVNALSTRISVPISVKIRAGLTESTRNAVEIAKTCEIAGASAVAIHGRTSEQMYTGKADWGIIREVKEALSIPVFGNGDVDSVEMFNMRMEESGVDAILIGRAAVHNPMIFFDISHSRNPEKEGRERYSNSFELLPEYINLAIKYGVHVSKARKHCLKLSKGIRNGAEMRRKMCSMKSLEELKEFVEKKIEDGI